MPLFLIIVTLPLLLGGCGYKPNLKYENLKYKITSDSVTITGCDNNASGELVIPDTIKGKPVTTIGEMAFFRTRFLSIPRSLTSITLPDSVTSIGSSAFRGCKNLTSITLPNSVTSIGESAFWGCASLTSITIPNSVTSIGENAFYLCKNLTSITIPDSVTSIGENAFYLCKNLTSITLPDSVTSIGSSAFRGCSNLTSITIPDSVTSIGDGAFNGCTNLTAVTFLGAAPKAGRRVFSRATPTIYRKPEAKGWGDTWDETVGDGTRDIPPVKLISEKP